jgi:hypothetical protein
LINKKKNTTPLARVFSLSPNFFFIFSLTLQLVLLFRFFSSPLASLSQTTHHAMQQAENTTSMHVGAIATPQRCWFEFKDVNNNQPVRMPLRHDVDQAHVAVGDLDYTLGHPM